MITEPLTPEQAWKTHDRDVCNPRHYDVQERQVADTAFKAGWSARDAELARLTAENAALRAACEEAYRSLLAIKTSTPDGFTLDDQQALEALGDALAATDKHKEPTK